MNIITREELNLIAEAALSVPTGDNCQPFELRWLNSELHIYYSWSTGHHALNHKGQAGLIALGCIFEAITLTCSQLGLAPQIFNLLEDTLQFTEYPQQDHWASIRFSRTITQPDSLYFAISKRFTDRRPYRPVEANSELIKKLSSHPTVEQGQFHFSCVTKELVNAITELDLYIWETKPIYRDLLKWARLSKKEVHQSADGMSAKNMGLNFAETTLFKIIRKANWIVPLLWHFGFKVGIKLRTRYLLKKTSGLILFTSQGNSSKDYIIAGQRCFRTWLNLTSIGYAVQPLSTSSFVLSSALDSRPPRCMSFGYIQKFQKQYPRILREFKVDEKCFPLWMFRIGGPIDAGEGLRTPRKNLSDFLKLVHFDAEKKII